MKASSISISELLLCLKSEKIFYEFEPIDSTDFRDEDLNIYIPNSYSRS